MTAARWGIAGLLLAAACEGLGGGARVDPRALPCADSEASAAWERARAALARHDDAAALPDLQACATRCPDFVRVHVEWQDCALRLGSSAAATMRAHYAAPGPGVVRAYLQARLLDTSYAKAQALDAVLKQDPTFSWAHLSRARIHRAQGRLLAALDMYAAAVQHDGKLEAATVERSEVLAELGRFEEAAVGFQSYVAAHPDDVAVVRTYVDLLIYHLNRIDEAFRWLDVLQQRVPGDVDVRMDRAAALWRAGRPREAAEAYLGILSEAPDRARAAWNLGLLYFDVVPKDDAERRVFWPAARAAFTWFLARTRGEDADEQFERTLGVPFRLQRIEALLGPAKTGASTLAELRWPRS